MATMIREFRGEKVESGYSIYVNGDEVSTLFCRGEETFDPTEADEYGDFDGSIYDIFEYYELTIVLNPRREVEDM